MSNNNLSQKFTFIDLIEKYNIEIPIIQRDYAQGREGKETLRKNFLTTLLNAVNGNTLELDFVYGNIKNNIFQPLDGQQRLTTLFLLHWFIAVKENKLDDKLMKLFTKFTYETRISSREFCYNLIENKIDFNNLLETDYYDKEKHKPKNNELSKTIIDSFWFFLSWKKDPTIKSMLTMLDAIHHIFKDTNDSWQKLGNISFQFVELQDLVLTDDLYIKMNARGKPLTDFENFKAKFEQYIKLNNWENNSDKTETFAHKIDKDWTNLFWRYRDDKNKIDDTILRFLTNCAMLFYAQKMEIFDDKNENENVRQELELKNKSKSITDDAVRRERIERRIAKLSNDYSSLIVEDFANKEAFDYLKECFNIYSKDNNYKLLPNLILWDYTSNGLFEEIINTKNASTYKQRVLFYAQTRYVRNVGSIFIEESFCDWMRVVRNIVVNATIDSATTFIGAINLIIELSKGCSTIHEFLSNNAILSNFAEEQVKEEIRKAKLIVNEIEIKSIVYKLEDTKFCKGTINWCLECTNNVEELKKIKDLIDLHLSQNHLSNLFRRALLTLGNNCFYNYWGTWSFSTNTHKKCLIEDCKELKDIFTKNDWLHNYLKPLIIQLCDDGNNLQNIVDKYTCPDTMPNWKNRLIKEPELLDIYCEGYYIGITDDDKQCYLYRRKKRPASRDECYLVE